MQRSDHPAAELAYSPASSLPSSLWGVAMLSRPSGQNIVAAMPCAVGAGPRAAGGAHPLDDLQHVVGFGARRVSAALSSAALCCATLRRAALCCAVMYSAASHCGVLWRAVLCRGALCCLHRQSQPASVHARVMGSWGTQCNHHPTGYLFLWCADCLPSFCAGRSTSTRAPSA